MLASILFLNFYSNGMGSYGQHIRQRANGLGNLGGGGFFFLLEMEDLTAVYNFTSRCMNMSSSTQKKPSLLLVMPKESK